MTVKQAPAFGLWLFDEGPEVPAATSKLYGKKCEGECKESSNESISSTCSAEPSRQLQWHKKCFCQPAPERFGLELA